MQETEETRVRSLVQEDPLEEEMATHCGILAWKISSMDRGAWWATVRRVRKRWTQLSDLAYVRIRLICFPRRVAGVRDMII